MDNTKVETTDKGVVTRPPEVRVKDPPILFRNNSGSN